MKYISTRKGIAANSAETIFQGLAADGGLFVPESAAESPAIKAVLERRDAMLGDAERAVFGALFDDLPETVREEAIKRLLSRFPEDEAIPLVEKDGLKMLELFHGKTGAFKDVALSMLPVLMRHSAGGKRVLILTATSGDTGSAAMQGFAGVEGTEIIVFYPATGTSKIQRLQMTTPSEANVHAIGIRGNFDDAQAAVKRIFADKKMNALAAAQGITLSSANSINTGRLVPQIAYYVLAAARLGREIDVVVPSGNFGNILAAYYAKRLGTPIRKLVVASNVNDVLARFVKTGIYDPGKNFTVTNSPSMDIRKSSNVERLLWMLNDGDCTEVARLMSDLEKVGRYELKPAAKERLRSEFEGGVATPEETEAEMRRMREKCGYLLDPHTAVATCVAKKLGFPREGAACVVAATATPYKFPETCRRAFGEDVLNDPPPSFRDLEKMPIAQTQVCNLDEIDDAVKERMTKMTKNEKKGLFERVHSFVKNFQLQRDFGWYDMAVLKTLMMLAAVDGDVSAEEISQFKGLASQCHGYNEKSFGKLWESSLRSAGYLMLQQRLMPQDELVKAFVKEAESSFVEEVSLEYEDDRKRAFKRLEELTMADGVCSPIERMCIDALKTRVDEEFEQSVRNRYSRAVTFDN